MASSTRTASPRHRRDVESIFSDPVDREGLSSEIDDESISRRLRRLQAESSMRAERAEKRKGKLDSRMPDW